MDLIQLGKIGKPHGFRGAFVTLNDAGRNSAFGQIKELHVGPNAETAASYIVTEASWMPRGWKIKLQGIESDTEVKRITGSLLFAERALLPKPVENEYYVGDLEGADVIDAESGEIIGKFVGVETTNGTKIHDRWWLTVADQKVAVPATGRYISKVDVGNRSIWVRNLSELS